MTGNTEQINTKENSSNAAKIDIVSKSWQVNIESLSVMDIGSLIQAATSMSQVEVCWDETQQKANDTPSKTSWARTGFAYINDLNFSFNDRTNSTKSIQLTGCGALKQTTQTFSPSPTPVEHITKGQFVRLFLFDKGLGELKVIAGSRNLSFHLSVSLENSSTKDTEGDWLTQEPTGYSFDISSSALVRSNDTISPDVNESFMYGSIEELYENANPVTFSIANVSGKNNREITEEIVTGEVVITQLTLSAASGSFATYDTQMQGHGELIL
jgi:hypothetical protein